MGKWGFVFIIITFIIARFLSCVADNDGSAFPDKEVVVSFYSDGVVAVKYA
jgi:hypothetical protein